jgi:acetyltransferase-like isoleucine patch superfamily enzyme
MIKRLVRALLFFPEFLIVYALGKIFGISLIVRYLRNPNPQITVKLLRSFGATIGERTTIKRSIILDNVYEDEHSARNFRYLKLGNNCYIGDCVYFDLSNQIILENNVVVSGQVSFVTHSDCNRSEYLSQKFPRQCQPIQVDDGTWIGFGATILSGVTIGKNSVIGAKSLLKEDVKEQVLYAGVPAKRIKDIDDCVKALF